MTQRPQVYLYSILAAGFAMMAYLSLRSSRSNDQLADTGRTIKKMQSQIGNIYGALRTERHRLDDLVNYIQPLRLRNEPRPPAVTKGLADPLR